MKFLFTLSFTLFASLLFGQWTVAESPASAAGWENDRPAPPKETLYLQRYRSVFFGVGPRYLNTDPGTIVTTFVDDSPSMDSFNTELDLKDGYVQPAINFGYKGGRYRGTSHDYLFDVTLASKSYTLKVAYSWGWNFLTEMGGKDLVIRPAIQGMIVGTTFNLGQLQNNDLYIQVGDRQYYEDELDVQLSAQGATVAPRLDFTYVFADRWDVHLKAAYDIPTGNSSPILRLKVPEDVRTEDSPADSTFSIDETTNPLVTFEGRRLTSLPYRTGGLRVTVGASFLWNR